MVQHSMVAGSTGAVVAVSGGPDSVAILDILVRLLGAASSGPTGSPAGQVAIQPTAQFLTQPGFRLTVAHLNHKLRGEASDQDAQFVSELARHLGLPAIMGVADVGNIAAKLKMGIEETSRAARYSFLFRAALSAGADRIVTGHTMNDQVETFIMRAARGSGSGGLAGMAPVRPAHRFDGIDIAIDAQRITGMPEPLSSSGQAPLLIRPALSVTREEIEQYCRDRSIAFRVDASNFSREFTRNRIRDVISGLCRVEPQAIRSIARAMEIIGADNQALDQLAERALDASRESNLAGQWPRVTGQVLDVNVLAGQPQAVLKRVVLRALREFPTDGCEITSAHLSAVEGLIRSGRSGKQVELPANIRVWREGQSIVIDRVDNACPPAEIELTQRTKTVRAGGFQITIQRNLSGDLYQDMVGRAMQEKARTGRDWGMAVLDDSLVPDTLVIRTRRPGERARVIGQSGSNKLKNLMINHRIPVSRRAFWPLAFTRDGRYVWSPGLPPSIEFAANREARFLAILSATND